MPRHLNLLHDPYSLSVPKIDAAFAKRHFDFSWLDGVPERRQALEDYRRDDNGYRVDVDACLASASPRTALLVWIAWMTARDRRRYRGRQIAFEVDEPTGHGSFTVYTTNPEQIARGEQ